MAAVEGMTPEEAWSGVKPIVEYFRVFGCIGFVHIPDQRRRKLDDKSKKCVFLGVSEESKAWRLYDPMVNRIVTSKDVVFAEGKSWDWDQAFAEGKEKTLECGDKEVDQNAEERGEATTIPEADSEVTPEANPTASGGNSVGGSLICSPSKSVSPSTSPVGGAVVTRRVTRDRKAPGWMSDYDTGEGEDVEENLSVMLLMMMTESDPVRFNEEVKDKVWREEMEREIESIVRTTLGS